MNADLQGILNYYGKKPIVNLLQCDNGYYLSDKQARVYLKHCLDEGHTELNTCPEWEEVKDKLNL